MKKVICRECKRAYVILPGAAQGLYCTPCRDFLQEAEEWWPRLEKYAARRSFVTQEISKATGLHTPEMMDDYLDQIEEICKGVSS